MSVSATARSLTFVHEKGEGLKLSVVLDTGHMWIHISAYQAALALSQLADYYAEQARPSYPEVKELPG